MIYHFAKAVKTACRNGFAVSTFYNRYNELERNDFMNFRYRLMQFMYGRYGMDTLSNAIIILSAICAVINLFLRSYLFQLIVYALIIWAFSRILSRNTEARRRENRFFTEKLNVFKNAIELKKQRRNDKTHIYKKCPACKAVLRLPHRLGEHTTICPRCGREFKVKVRK